MDLRLRAAGVLIFGCSIALPPAFIWLQVHQHAPARVYIRPALFSPDECASIIRTVDAAGLWGRETGDYVVKTDQVHLPEVPALSNVTLAVETRVMPLLREAYGVPLGEELRLANVYIIRYMASSEEQPGLEMHADESTLTFSVALSPPDAYGSGGLEVDLLDAPLRLETGGAVIFPSKLLHRGVPVTRGSRYALVGLVVVGDPSLWTFSYSTDPPRIASAINGMWALCATLVEMPPTPESPVSSGAAATVHGETCISTPRLVTRRVSIMLKLVWRNGSHEDLMELIYLNSAIAAGALVLYFLT